jgi:hypothetical protein
MLVRQKIGRSFHIFHVDLNPTWLSHTLGYFYIPGGTRTANPLQVRRIQKKKGIAHVGIKLQRLFLEAKQGGIQLDTEVKRLLVVI